MERAEADVQCQFGPQAFQGEVGLFGHGAAQSGFVATIERHLFGERRSGRNLAGGLIATNELTNPLGTNRVLATQVGKLQTALKVR